jgi:tetratricopeptide (TPR) repeat protein
LDPKAKVAWNNRGISYLNLHQYEKAIADLSRAIELDAKCALPWSSRGYTYSELHQHEKAIADFNRAIELDPKWTTPWNYRGCSYFDLHQYEKAIADFNRAIEPDPKLTTPWYNRGYSYLRLHQYEKAIADFNRAIELDPKWMMPWFYRGYIYCKELHQYEKGIADLSTAIKLNSKFAWSHHHLAWLLATCANPTLRDPRRAVELAKKAVELEPANGDYWRTLGAAHYCSGEWMLAIRCLKKSRDLDKDNNGLDYFFLAMASWQLGEKDQARRWYGQGVQWMDKNRPKDETFQRFRSEAAKLLGLEKKND